jgi:pimeloyl-ACP methyl ester carboxylesterase
MDDFPSMPRLTRRSLLALLAGAPAVAAFGQIPPTSAIRTLTGRLTLPDGRCLGYTDLGDVSGPLVLYFHGTPGSRIEASLIADEALTCGVRLVSIDRPGIGLSSRQPGQRVLDWPADVANFVAALGYGESAFGVIGVSGGAPYALACVCRIPERLTHVGLVSGHTPMAEPNSGRGNQDAFMEFLLRRPRLGRMAIAAIIRRLHKHPDKVMARVAGEAAASDRQLLLGTPTTRAGFHANLLAATRGGADQVMNAVRLLGTYWGFRLADLPPAPLSIWQGGCDPIAPPAAGRYFHRQLTGSEFYFDPTAGHATMLKWHAREILAKFI